MFSGVVTGQGNNQGELGKFGGLKVEKAEINPALSAGLGPPENKGIQEQEYDKTVQYIVPVKKNPIIETDNDENKAEPHNEEIELFDVYRCSSGYVRVYGTV
jgi:hypothetical protein